MKTEPILDPSYWAYRLKVAQGNGGANLHHAVFRCPKAEWDAIAERHREILAQVIRPTDSILDAGCGWGRLLELLPRDWSGSYLGLDLSPDLLKLANGKFGTKPNRTFAWGDLQDLSFLPGYDERLGLGWDWAVLISIRPMVRRNLGEEVWERMLSELCRVSRKILFLEYDVNDRGTVCLSDLGTEEYAT